MQKKLTIDIDEKTVELAEIYAREKGFSLNEMFEYYLKWIVWNETFIRAPNIINEVIPTKKEGHKKGWADLEDFLSKNRFDLPENYNFNRNELYDR